MNGMFGCAQVQTEGRDFFLELLKLGLNSTNKYL